MIPVQHEEVEAGFASVQELCCFCFQRTRYWYVRNDVAVCQACAKTHRVGEVPTKAVWWQQVEVHLAQRRVASEEDAPLSRVAVE